MKRLKYLLFLLPFFVGCRNNEKTKLAVAKKNVSQEASKAYKKQPDTTFASYNYHFTDTGYYNTGIGDGVYVVLKRKGKLIDTIDLYYGVKQIYGDKFLYYKIRGGGPASKGDSNPQYKKSINASPDHYIIVADNRNELLNNLTPDFDDYFSSPAIVDHRIYYWRIKKIDSADHIRVSAAEYDPATKKTYDHFIMNDILETDDGGYFPQPYSKNDTIYFMAGDDKLKKFSKDFKPYN